MGMFLFTLRLCLQLQIQLLFFLRRASDLFQGLSLSSKGYKPTSYEIQLCAELCASLGKPEDGAGWGRNQPALPQCCPGASARATPKFGTHPDAMFSL